MSEHKERWRLIHTPHLPGARNMAVDEGLMESVGLGDQPVILRLYGWSPPCLSLGYAQPVGQVDERAVEERGWHLVRRPTGGRAILHTDELTYAVIGPVDHWIFRGGVLPSYKRISSGLQAALVELGLDPEVQPSEDRDQSEGDNPICFEVPSAYEITLQGRKLIGSAQVRRKSAVLQHGSLPLEGDVGWICQVLRFPSEKERVRAAERLRDRATTVERELQRTVNWQAAAEAIASGFERALQIDLTKDRLTEEEQATAAALENSRYGVRAWLDRS